jgi:hypothetical protein
MSKVYKIHPGIGIARVGPSTDGYFLAGEASDALPIDIDANGEDIAFKGYKDAAHFMRRQGVRFRVFEYDKVDATGVMTLAREITASDATIVWTVKLAAAKAAGFEMTMTMGPDGVRTLTPGTQLRNMPPAGFTLPDLRADVALAATGVNAGPAPGAEPMGRIVGQDILIGEARTDAKGRLIVLAGHGVSRSWQQPAPDMQEFLNNPTWYDDIADGTVDARITIAGGAPIDAIGAWVVTTPPDFAPDTMALTTLLDVVEQATNIPLPSPLTYPQDIEPMLRRAADLFFVNEVSVWKTMHAHMANPAGLSDNSATAAAKRKLVRDDLLKAEDGTVGMNSFRITTRQRTMLQRWVDGNFRSAADGARRPPNAAEMLDRASLEHCVGGGFFPGIEAGTILRLPSLYSQFAQLTRGTFTDSDGVNRPLQPGVISQRMACPWQADFAECLLNWWPAQRPDLAGRLGNGNPGPRWDRGIIVGNDPEDPQSHLNMVQRFARLGLIVKDKNTGNFVEVGRDPTLADVA